MCIDFLCICSARPPAAAIGPIAIVVVDFDTTARAHQTIKLFNIWNIMSSAQNWIHKYFYLKCGGGFFFIEEYKYISDAILPSERAGKHTFLKEFHKYIFFYHTLSFRYHFSGDMVVVEHFLLFSSHGLGFFFLQIMDNKILYLSVIYYIYLRVTGKLWISLMFVGLKK